MWTVADPAILRCLEAIRKGEEGSFRAAFMRFLSRACREEDILRSLLSLIPQVTPAGMIFTGQLTADECEDIVTNGFPLFDADSSHLLKRVAGNAQNVVALRETVQRRLGAGDETVARMWRE